MTFLQSNQTLVLTGVTAGFGEKALHQILGNARCPVIIGARNPDRVRSEIAQKVTVLPLDLASFHSVATFCDGVRERGTVGGMILNAGVSARKLLDTPDGINLTFQTNYLSHFAMIQALWATLSDEAHVVVTSSGTHDPREKTPPPPPRHADAARLARPKTDPDLDRSGQKAASRAYTSSKLCCTMLSLELAARREKGTSISFDPGLVPGTSLTREFPAWLVKLLVPIMSRTMPADRTSTLPASAVALAQFMAQTSFVGSNGDYVAMRGGYPIVVNPSDMARDANLRAALWRDSEQLLMDNPAWPS